MLECADHRRTRVRDFLHTFLNRIDSIRLHQGKGHHRNESSKYLTEPRRFSHARGYI